MSEEVALANGLVAELAAAQATIAGQRRVIEQLRAEILERAEKDAEDTHRLQRYCAGQMADITDMRTLINQMAAQSATDHVALTELRRALATAQAELDGSQPIVIAAARLVASIHGDGNGRCWCGAREADQLRSALEKETKRSDSA